MLYYRETSDGRFIGIMDRLYTTAILIGKVHDDSAYDSHWCYERKDQAFEAADKWKPETEPDPEGWIRNPATGRRRPGGEKSKEYVDW